MPTPLAEPLNCTVQHPVNLGNVRHLQQKILDLNKVQQMAEFFSLVGKTNRLRILSMLAVQELCVRDLAAASRDERVGRFAPASSVADNAFGRILQARAQCFLFPQRSSCVQAVSRGGRHLEED